MLRLLLSMAQARLSDVGFWGVKQIGQSAGNDAHEPTGDMARFLTSIGSPPHHRLTTCRPRWAYGPSFSLILLARSGTAR